MPLKNSTYDKLKKLASVGLPALAVFVGAIGEIWKLNLPMVEISLTIMALDTFLGALLEYSTAQYNKQNGG